MSEKKCPNNLAVLFLNSQHEKAMKKGFGLQQVKRQHKQTPLFISSRSGVQQAKQILFLYIKCMKILCPHLFCLTSNLLHLSLQLLRSVCSRVTCLSRNLLMRYGHLGCHHDNQAVQLVCCFLETESQKGTSSLQLLIESWDLVTMEMQIKMM